MADTDATTTQQTGAQAPNETPEGQEPQGTDWKAEARKWEKRAKENKDTADKLQKLIDDADAKGREADAKEQKASEALEQLRQENKRLQDSIAREHKVREVAAQKGVDPEILLLMNCETDEDISAYADKLARSMAASAEQKSEAKPKWPETKDNGSNGKAPGLTKEGILAIEDKKERRKAIKENLALFEH